MTNGSMRAKIRKMNWKVIKGSIRDILRVKYFYYSLLFILANLFFTSEIMNSVGTPHKNMILVVEVVLECSLLSLLYYVKKKKCTIEKVFLTIAIPLGFCFALFMPLGQVPDEPAHIWRSYGVSDGVFVVPIDEEGRAGSYLPKNINEFSWWNPSAGALRKTFTNLDDPVSEETKFVDYIMTANYNPLCYAPQVIAILISKLFRFPLAVMLIFARLMNLAFFIAIIYYALKIVPKFKSFILFFSLLPITLQQAASFSPDALLISTCTLMIAFVLNLIFVKRGRMNKWEIALLYVLAIIVGLSKAAYSPLILSYFLIPKERFGSGKKKILHAIGIGLFVFLDFIWIIYSSRYFTVLSSDVVPDQQKAFLIEHPYSSALIFIRSIATNMQFYLSSMLGNNLGTLQISMPVFYHYFSFALMILILAQNKEHLRIKNSQRIVFAVSLLSVLLLVFFGLYVQCTPVAALTILGIQGRYFLPVLLLVPVLLSWVPRKTSDIHVSVINSNHVALYSIAINVCALAFIVAPNL